jgi:hypothetical protein
MREAVQLTLFGDYTPGAALSLIGRCPACNSPVTGMASMKWPHLVTLDIHLHPRIRHLGWCIGSRSAGDYWVRRDYPKIEEPPVRRAREGRGGGPT